jgi:hypothetical protein
MEIEASHQARMNEITTKAQHDLEQMQADFMANVQQAQVSADTEMEKDQHRRSWT